MTAALAGATPAPADERLARTSLFRKMLIRPEFGALAGAIVVWLLFAWQGGDTWLSWAGTKTYVETASLYGLTAIAVCVLMIGGEFDLSAGVMTGTTGMFTGVFAVHLGGTGVHMGVALLMSLAVAVAIGVFNGYMVVKSGLPSFIVTLGTFFALQGFNLWFTQRITHKTQVTGIKESAGYELGRKIFFSDLFHIGSTAVQTPQVWFIVLTAVAAWILTRTKLGNWIFAVGGNKEAARMVGVPATATKIGLFVAVAVCGWIRGNVYLFKTSGVNVTEGVGVEFYFIVACVLGGCLLTGGLGSAVGAALGCLILGMTQRGIPLAGWDNNLYFLFLGVILLVAAFSNEWIRRWARTASRPSPKRVEQSAAEGAQLAAATQAMVKEGELS